MFDVFFSTPLKINMEHNSLEVWKIIFLSKWVICGFHVNLPGCTQSVAICIHTPLKPTTNSSHPARLRHPKKGNNRLPTIRFQVRVVRFGEGIEPFLWEKVTPMAQAACSHHLPQKGQQNDMLQAVFRTTS